MSDGVKFRIVVDETPAKPGEFRRAARRAWWRILLAALRFSRETRR